MKVKKESKVRYAYPLKIDEKLKTPLKMKALINKRTVNQEINVAIENHLKEK